MKFALAAPAETVPDVTAEPMVVGPFLTVNVTVPVFTVPGEVVTVALSGTVWLLTLYTAVAFAAVVVVPWAWMTGIESVFVLLVVTLSVQVHATDTLLVKGDDVLAATFTFRTRDDVPPELTIAFVVVHTTGFVPPAPHDHPAVGDAVNVRPVGSVSVTVTVPLLAADPPLVTVTVIVSPTSFAVKLDGA
jgi:hypothetical protein